MQCIFQIKAALLGILLLSLLSCVPTNNLRTRIDEGNAINLAKKSASDHVLLDNTLLTSTTKYINTCNSYTVDNKDPELEAELRGKSYWIVMLANYLNDEIYLGAQSEKGVVKVIIDEDSGKILRTVIDKFSENSFAINENNAREIALLATYGEGKFLLNASSKYYETPCNRYTMTVKRADLYDSLKGLKYWIVEVQTVVPGHVVKDGGHVVFINAVTGEIIKKMRR